jgi:hypothetical protein
VLTPGVCVADHVEALTGERMERVDDNELRRFPVIGSS